MRWARVLVIVMAGLAACTTFPVIKPLYPPVSEPSVTPKVDSLQPTLRWEASKTVDVSYDVIIYEGIEVVYPNPLLAPSTPQYQVGKMAYYREAIDATEHRLEEPLKPDRVYFWSVRTRKGDRHSDWARYDYTLFLGVGYTQVTNAMFSFRTPKTS